MSTVQELEGRVRELENRIIGVSGHSPMLAKAWEVIEVNEDGTCDVQGVHDGENLRAGAVRAEVEKLDGRTPAVGERGMLGRRGDGRLVWFPGFPIMAFLTGLSGYNAGKTQFLRHVSGVLQWIDAGEC